MTAAYKQKITQAFRDNAIRSVLLIDDEYYPYGNLVEHQSSLLEKLSEIKSIDECDPAEYKDKISQLLNSNFDIKRSQVAKKFVNFFHETKRICDVESDTDNLDHERIRKSDLIVLDYYLKSDGQGNRAESSLNLIYDLSNSKHMNIVVVYTGENLNQVWLEIAATLRGSKNVDSIDSEKKFVLQKWDDNKEEWLEIWEKFVNENMKSDFLLGCSNLREITTEFKAFCTDENIETAFQDHIPTLLENSINALNHNDKSFKNISIHGEKGIWLQAGNVFISLCSKQEKETPEKVWECVEKALHSWNPSFYRVVTSELQNQIEDANLSMEKSISYRDRDQMAFLWGILQTKDKDKERITRELLGNIATEALDGILYDSNFISDVVETALLISDESTDYVPRDKLDEQPHKDFQRKILELVEKNVAKDISTPKDEKHYEVVHSYNEKLSTTPHFPKYITTGSILCDEDNNWYICVTPSCNTVPNQMTDASASALTPHRSLTLAKLVKVTPIKNAIHNAHHSSYIYISSNDKVLAFSVLNEESKLPNLIKVIVMNHDTEEWENDGSAYKDITIFETKSDQEVTNKISHISKKIYPIALLKPAYAARYQNIQSHYEGRIGVDFITLDLSESEQPTDNGKQ